MMLYLTGASTSLSKSEEAPQTDPSKSLGGYASSTPVPNNSLNALFDSVSASKPTGTEDEVIAVALINESGETARNVTIEVEQGENSRCKFYISAVKLSKKLSMESIQSRYQEPFSANFIDCSSECVLLTDELEDGGGIGIWIKRSVLRDYKVPTDEEMIEKFKSGETSTNEETATLIIRYNE